MNIEDKIDNLEDTKASEALKGLLKEYIKPAYGAMSKRDFDIMLFMKLQDLEVIETTPKVYDVVSSLRVTRAKARNLIYESKLRTSTEEELEKELKELISSPILKDDDKVSLEIENPYLVDYIRSVLKRLGHITDGSFSNEILKMTTDAYVALFESLVPDDKKNEIKDTLVRCGALPDTSFTGILKSITKKLVSKVIGNVSDDVVDNVSEVIGNVSDDVVDNVSEVIGTVSGGVSDYLKPIIEGQIDIITTKFTNFWNDQTN